MNVGVLLPTFADSAAPALAMAHEAAALGLDGVFAYDHLYPMGAPERPALAPFPVLAVVARECPMLDVGPLVARVGLGDPEHLLAAFDVLAALAPGRVIAALGTGDRLSAAENEAYGLAYPSADERRADLRTIVTALAPRQRVWVGAGGPATNAIALEAGIALNVWQRPVDDLPSAPEVTWAGRFDDDLEGHLSALAAAGVTYAVGVPTTPLARMARWRRDLR
jgi:Luciferase-like monooxygenase